MKIEEIRTYVATLVALGAAILWGSTNMVFSKDLDERLSPLEQKLEQIRIENIEEKVLALTTEIAVLEYRKKQDEWTGEDEIRLRTMLEQREQLKKKLEK